MPTYKEAMQKQRLSSERFSASLRKESDLKVIGRKDISAYLRTINYSGESVVKYFSNLYGRDTVITRKIEESNFPIASLQQTEDSSELLTLQVSSMPSFTMNLDIKNLNSVTFDHIKEKSKEVFLKEMVYKSRDREASTVRIFNGLIPDGRYGVITFLNSIYEGIDSQTLLNDTGFINQEYASELLVKRLGGEIRYVDPDKTNKKEEQDLNKLVDIMLEGVIDAKQFSGILYALINPDNVPDPVQAKKSGKTINELVSIINLKRLARLLTEKVDGKNMTVKSSVSSAGSEAIEEFRALVENVKDPQELMKITKNFTEKLIVEKSKKSNSKEIKASELTGLAIGQKFFAGSGSSETKNIVHAADLIFSVKEKDMFIDVKAGVGKKGSGSSRYKMSTPLKTSIESIYNNSLLDEGTKNSFFDQLEIIVNYLFYRLRVGKIEKKDYDNRVVKKLITYALLSSREFINYYRTIMNDGSFVQPDFLLTLAGYVWYSDFFEVVSESLFGTKGASVSLKLKYASVKLPKKATDKQKERLKQKQKADYIQNMIKFLESTNSDKDEIEEFKKFSDLFIVSKQVEFELDVDDVFKKVQTMLKAKNFI